MEDYKQIEGSVGSGSIFKGQLQSHKASPTPYGSHSLQNTTTNREPGVSEVSLGRRFQIQTKTFSQVQGSAVKFELHDTILRRLSTPFYTLKLLKWFPFDFMCVSVSLARMSHVEAIHTCWILPWNWSYSWFWAAMWVPQSHLSSLYNLSFIIMFCLVFETGSFCVAQAGLQLLGSSAPLASASWAAATEQLALWVTPPGA